MAPIVIVRNRASSQNLVESTKGLHNFMSSLNQLERIKLDSKSARRKEKDDKKEKRKHKSHHKHSSKKDSSKKVSDDESSGLTQELGEPQKDLGYLSDGSQNSKKRKRVDSPPALESTIKAEPVDGKPLKIKFVFKRSKVDGSPSLPREDLPVCSTSGAASLDNREKVVQAVVKSSVPCLKQSEPKEILSLPSKSAVAETKTLSPVSVLDNREKLTQAVVTSSVPCVRVPEPVKNLPSTSALVETKRKKHRPSKEDRYNALFDNWDPSPICLPAIDSSNDDDWLFGSSRRTQDKLSSRAAVQDMNMSLQNKAGEVSCWPRAQLLPEVGIYSLPYTVPF